MPPKLSSPVEMSIWCEDLLSSVDNQDKKEGDNLQTNYAMIYLLNYFSPNLLILNMSVSRLWFPGLYANDHSKLLPFQHYLHIGFGAMHDM